MAECHGCQRKPITYKDSANVEKDNNDSCLSENLREQLLHKMRS